MITNFEKITSDLTDIELALIPYIVTGLKNFNKENAIKAPRLIQMINATNSLNHKLTEPRLRKMVNYIRSNGLLPLIATSKGYYVSHDKKEIEAQIESLLQRANSIEQSAKGLQNYLRNLY